MRQPSDSSLLFSVALFKLVKASVLIALGIAAFSLVHDADALTTLHHVANAVRIDPHNRLVNWVMNAVLGLDTRRLEELGVGTFVYAAIFLVEGIGLLLRKRWAEYLTACVTASFIPLEIWETVHKPRVLKLAGIALNVLIVSYLVARRWRGRVRAPS